MLDVFKAAAAKAKDVAAKSLPFEVRKEHLSLTIDSNLVYYAAPHNYENEDCGHEIGVWSLFGNRKTVSKPYDPS